MKVEKYIFEEHGDNRGQLVAIEQNKNIPFEIKRVYYIYDTKSDVIRGKHAHRSLEQILVCVHGSCKILLDDGKEREEFVLNKPNVGIHISNVMWREMLDFSKDAVLLVLASELYNEEDYIRDYDEFKNFVNKEK